MHVRSTLPKLWAYISSVIMTALFIASVPTSASTVAQKLHVTVLLSSNDVSYRSVTEQIVNSSPSHIEIEVFKAYPNKRSLNTSDLIVTLGSTAFEAALLDYPDTPILASFIPRRSYKRLIEKFKRNSNKVSALFIDQPMSRQIHLARLLLPNALIISTLFGQSSLEEKTFFEAAAIEYQFIGSSSVLASTDNPINVINPLISDSDAFLAIPDQGAFNRASAKWSLYLSLRHKKPLIGFSETYVNAGALAAVYSTTAQVGTETGELIAEFQTNRQLSSPSYPKYFEVKINTSTARQLDLYPPSSDQLRSALQGNS